MTIEPLPDNDNDFWKGADVKEHKPRKVTCAEHTFRHNGAMQAECDRCGVGFTLSPGMEVRNGHIYNEQGLVI